MGGTLTLEYYRRLLTENIEWLMKQPRTLERDHIELLLKTEIRELYIYKADLLKIEEQKKNGTYLYS